MSSTRGMVKSRVASRATALTKGSGGLYGQQSSASASSDSELPSSERPLVGETEGLIASPGGSELSDDPDLALGSRAGRFPCLACLCPLPSAMDCRCRVLRPWEMAASRRPLPASSAVPLRLWSSFRLLSKGLPKPVGVRERPSGRCLGGPAFGFGVNTADCRSAERVGLRRAPSLGEHALLDPIELPLLGDSSGRSVLAKPATAAERST